MKKHEIHFGPHVSVVWPEPIHWRDLPMSLQRAAWLMVERNETARLRKEEDSDYRSPD